MSARIDPFPLAPNFGVTQLQVFLAWATSNSASDIVFQTGDRVWGELKGRQVPLTMRAMKEGELKMLLSLAFGNEVIGVIKSGRDMDRPYGFVIERTAYRYRVNISGAHIGDADDGLSITLRAIPQTPPTLDTLGLPVGIRENLFQPHGLVLICGPTGSGKTTLMSSFYAAVSQSKRDAKILLYEDPIEFLFSTVKNIGPKIRQMQIGRHIPSFAHGLRNAMRCKPTLIGIGEARDAETIRALVEAALTGHGAYGTMHTESVAQTINRAIQVFPLDAHCAIASKLLDALRLIVVQILVPTLDGERSAVREWLYFSREIKERMSAMPFAQWGAFLNQEVRSMRQDRATGLRQLLDRQRIDQTLFRRYAGEAVA